MRIKITFGLWVVCIASLLVFLGRLHQTPLPPAPPQAPLPASPAWHLIHFLVPDCVCSESVANYLIHRGPQAGSVTEEVIVLGPPGAAPALAAQLGQAGWGVTSAELGSPASRGVRGGPWLVVFDPSGRARYSGGYLGRQIVGPHDPFQDLAVLDRLRHGEAVTPFGPFGCLVGWKATAQAH